VLIVAQDDLCLLCHLIVAFPTTEDGVVCVIKDEPSKSLFIPEHFDLSDLFVHELLRLRDRVGSKLGRHLTVIRGEFDSANSSTDVPTTSGHSQVGELVIRHSL
jgi:hypothetical protein